MHSQSLRSPRYLATSASTVALVLLFGAVLLWSYHFAQGLTWQFDDQINLGGLVGVSDRQGFLNFVAGGVAGPAGRPLSLLSFVPNYADWPGNPWGMVQGNVLLHLLNGLLAWLLLAQLWRTCPSATRAVDTPPVDPLPWAALGAVLWAALAIHATAILMPVQRMTLVSAFFVLLTLWLFVVVRRRWAGAGGMGPLIGISAIVGLGTALAILGKESGALAVSLVAVLETLWLRHLPAPAPRRLWRLWVLLAWLAVPLVLLVQYGVRDWAGLMNAYAYYRPFSLAERLATESVILWEYVRQTLLPRPALLGPFHDGHAVYNWAMWQPWAASAAWVALLAGLWRWARTEALGARVVLLAVVFYLVSHQIESTFVALELYFEHRNYVGTLCMAFAAAVWLRRLWMYPGRGHKAATGGVVALMLAWQLFAVQQVASAFGNPLLGAELWYRYHPQSARAAQTLAWQFGINGWAEASLRIADEFANADPQNVGVRIQALTQSCRLYKAEAADHEARLDQMRKEVKSLKSTSGLVTGLRALGETVRDGACSGVTLQTYQAFLEAAEQNTAVRHSPAILHHVSFELAETASKIGLQADAIRYAKQAFYSWPSISAAERAATLMFQDEQLDEAIAWTDEVVTYAPRGMAELAWRERFGSMKTAFMSIRGQIHSAPENRQDEQRK